MSTLPEQHHTFKQQLSDKPTKQQLWKIINDFISFFSTESIKEELWFLPIGTLSSNQVMEVDKGIGRHNRIFFYEHSSLFINAVNRLYQQREKKKKKRNHNSKAQPSVGPPRRCHCSLPGPQHLNAAHHSKFPIPNSLFLIPLPLAHCLHPSLILRSLNHFTPTLLP
jgi:hypothetical protein